MNFEWNLGCEEVFYFSLVSVFSASHLRPHTVQGTREVLPLQVFEWIQTLGLYFQGHTLSSSSVRQLLQLQTLVRIIRRKWRPTNGNLKQSCIYLLAWEGSTTSAGLSVQSYLKGWEWAQKGRRYTKPSEIQSSLVWLAPKAEYKLFFAIGRFFKVQAPFLKMSRVGYIKLYWAQCHSAGISAMLASSWPNLPLTGSVAR